MNLWGNNIGERVDQRLRRRTWATLQHSLREGYAGAILDGVVGHVFIPIDERLLDHVYNTVRPVAEGASAR